MAYLETIKKKEGNWYYLTQTIRLGNKYKKVRVFLAKGDVSKTKLNSLAKNKKKELFYMVNSFRQTKGLVEISAEKIAALNRIKKEYSKILSSLSKIEYEVIEKHHLINFTFNTNAIEGSTITLKETSHILEDHISPEGKDLREIHEIENTKTAYDLMKRYKGNINSRFIKSIHYNLTHNILGDNAGQYRRIQVYMGGSKHTPTKASEVPKEMITFVRWIKNNAKLHPVLLASYVHHFFIAIHPFIYGNGRTGRLLLNYMLMTSGFPPICIRLNERIRYTDYLELARDGDVEPLVTFIITKLEEAFRDFVDNSKY